MSLLLIDSFPYDLLISGELTLESEITEFPVEDGADITDHIRTKPAELKLESMVSDTPIGEIANDPSRRVDDVSIAVFGSDQVPLPSAEAYERLTQIHSDRRVVTIEIPVATRGGQPGKRTYKNMALESLSIPTSKDTDGGLTFSASFKEVTFRQNNRTTVRTATPSGQRQTNSKSKATKPYKAVQLLDWNMGQPPGAPLAKNFPAAILQFHDGTSGPKGTANLTFYAYPLGKELISPYQLAQGKVLTQDQANAFFADLKRDRDLKKLQQLIKSGSVRRIDGTFPSQDAAPTPGLGAANVGAPNQNLPPGVDLSRFSQDVPNQNLPSGVDLSRF
jgi:hypothetical protein